MEKFRTSEQFEEICLNIINGNHSDAVKQVIEFGFYASDLIEAIDNRKDQGTFYNEIEPYFLTIIERAATERAEKKMKNLLKMNKIFY